MVIKGCPIFMTLLQHSHTILHLPVSKYACFLHMSDHKSPGHCSNSSGLSTPDNHSRMDDEDMFSKMGSSRMCRKYPMGLSCSDAEVDYRRGRSLRERKGV